MCRRNKHAIGPSETDPGIARHAMDFQSKQQFIFAHEAIEVSLACPESRPFHYQPVIHDVRVGDHGLGDLDAGTRSEEHTSELQSLMRISSAVFCLKKKNTLQNTT